MAIKSLKTADSRTFFESGILGKGVGWMNVASVAARKLDMLNAATHLDDLRAPPANRLEALQGALAGYYSIRVNDQWRVVFRWTGNDAEDVFVCDYH